MQNAESILRRVALTGRTRSSLNRFVISIHGWSLTQFVMLTANALFNIQATCVHCFVIFFSKNHSIVRITTQQEITRPQLHFPIHENLLRGGKSFHGVDDSYFLHVTNIAQHRLFASNYVAGSRTHWWEFSKTNTNALFNVLFIFFTQTATIW